MPPLTPTEARVLGALVEKQIATPDYYPLSLNALVNACNQKNHRDPVVTYDESTVLRALETLRLKNLAYIFAGAAERVRKYGHTFPKTLALDPAETALLCVLLLRGPQTPGELRSRTAYLHNFASLDDVEATLDRLETSATPVSKSADFDSAKEDAPTTRAPLIRKLPRSPGTKESRYIQLLTGEPSETSSQEVSSSEASAKEGPPDNSSPETIAENSTTTSDQDRITRLESEITQLKSQITELQAQFATFRKQFE